MKAPLDEVVRAMEKAANILGKSLEESMFLSKARRKTLTPLGPP